MVTKPALEKSTDWSLTDVSPWHEGRVLEVRLRSLPQPPAPWIVESLLAEGGMAELYRVRCGEDGFEAVLKTPHRSHANTERLSEGLRAEAGWLQVLTLPDTPWVLDQGELPDGRAFYVMTLSRGQTLRDWVNEGTPALGDAVSAVAQAARIVARAHERGVIHRDLKPSNIMRDATGKVTVVDWGLTTRMDPHGPSARRLCGTPAYLAPEVIARQAGATMPTLDVWALACTLVCLLEGHPPSPWNWASKSLDGLQAPRQAHPWQGETDGPAEQALPELLRAALHPDPSLRTADAGLLAGELEGWLARFAPGMASQAA